MRAKGIQGQIETTDSSFHVFFWYFIIFFQFKLPVLGGSIIGGKSD